tara:strand:+ start:182 stop:361 length:180 start_codon:yes stop_codon:yes gene_type:complete
MESEKKSIKVEMTWVATAKMLCAILEDGSDKAFARAEIVRMGSIIDHLNKTLEEARESS